MTRRTVRAPAGTRRKPSRRPPRSPSPPSVRRRSRCRCPTRRRLTAAHRPTLPDTAHTCLSCPRSRSSAAVWPPVSPAARSAASPCCIPARSAGTCPGPDDFAAQLVGRTFAEPRRRGKYLWLPLTDGDAVLAHLGMSGQFRLAAAGAPYAPNTRVLVGFTDGEPALRFVDQRMFGGLSLSQDGAELPAEVAHIAPRPVRPRVRPRRRVRRLRAKRTGVKRALLDQQLVFGDRQHLRRRGVVAGRMHYARPTDSCRGRRPAGAERGRRGDGGGPRAGGTSFDGLYVNVNGSSGYFDRSLAAYGREGEPCPRCGTPIRREPFMNRSSYRCPRCQRTPSALTPASDANITPAASRIDGSRARLIDREPSEALRVRPARPQLDAAVPLRAGRRLRRLRQPAGRDHLQQDRPGRAQRWRGTCR